MKTVVKGIGFALNGLVYALKNDRHMRINFCLAVFAITVSFLVLKDLKMIFVAFVNYMVVVIELLNTALERAVDIVTPEFHPLAKASKDISCAAVLSIGIFAFVIDVVYLLPNLLELACRILERF